MVERLHAIRERLERHGQAHLLRFFEELTPPRRAALLAQIERIDLDAFDQAIAPWKDAGARGHAMHGTPAMHGMHAAHGTHDGHARLPDALEPAPYYPSKHDDPVRSWDAAGSRRRGEALVREGRLAAFTVAGGQGTRLGWNGPKGTFPATPVTGKPLFRIFAEQIVAAQERYGIEIPWYVMTSPANDAQTRAFFLDNNCFGLSRTNIFLFPQGMMPSADRTTGRLLLAERGSLALSPDGHGGSLRALHASGALEDMRARGIEHISYFQVDNPLVHVVDPRFLGLHATAPDSAGQMSSKMVWKASPDEKVGVFCRANGHTMVIEYSDLPEGLSRATDDAGRLRFGAGSIAVHLISIDFVERLTAGGELALPFHHAIKSVPYVDIESGRDVEPAEPNALKLETFIFDAIPMAGASIVLETERTEEFAPIKNATGADSPATSRQIQSERAARWLEAHGVEVARDGAGRVAARLEISPLTALECEDLARVRNLPARIAAGAEVAL